MAKCAKEVENVYAWFDPLLYAGDQILHVEGEWLPATCIEKEPNVLKAIQILPQFQPFCTVLHFSGASRPGIKMENLKDAINILPDVINDVGHSLYSRYKNYVVHSAEGEHPAVSLKKISL